MEQGELIKRRSFFETNKRRPNQPTSSTEDKNPIETEKAFIEYLEAQFQQIKLSNSQISSLISSRKDAKMSLLEKIDLEKTNIVALTAELERNQMQTKFLEEKIAQEIQRREAFKNNFMKEIENEKTEIMNIAGKLEGKLTTEVELFSLLRGAIDQLKLSSGLKSKISELQLPKSSRSHSQLQILKSSEMNKAEENSNQEDDTEEDDEEENEEVEDEGEREGGEEEVEEEEK